MIGYACSSGEDGNCRYAGITVFYTDAFELTDESSKEIYIHDRYNCTYNKVYPADDVEFGLKYSVLEKVFRLLHIEEIIHRTAVRIAWRCNTFSDVEIIKSESVDTAWMPSPLYIDGCSSACVNVTDKFYDYLPKPLEVSMLCDLLNLAFEKAGAEIANPFYHCFNSVYCDIEFAVFLYNLCKLDLTEGIRNLPDDVSIRGKYRPINKHTRRKMIDRLKSDDIPEPAFRGSDQSFAVDIKRECVSYIYETAAKIIHTSDCESLFRVTQHFSEEIRRFGILSEVFVLGDNLSAASDIMYLTLYELMSAFGIYEDRLNLKKTVAASKARRAILNRMKIPVIILPDGSVKYE